MPKILVSYVLLAGAYTVDMVLNAGWFAFETIDDRVRKRWKKKKSSRIIDA